MKANNHKIYTELMQLIISIKHQNEIINLNKKHGALGEVTSSTFIYHDFDGHGTLDVYDQTHDFKIVTQADMKTDKYSANNSWKIIRTPTATTYGIVARDSYHSGFVQGLGLNFNRFKNGISTDASITQQLNVSPAAAISNNAIKTDGGNYRIILTTDEKAKLAYKDNPAHTLMRTFVANKEVIEADAVRNMVLGSFIENMTHVQLGT